MAIKVNSIRCPECGASLPIEEGRKQIFCSYCGSKVIVTDENEYVYRHIDEAGVKKAETDRIVRLKKLEMKEKRNAINQKMTKTKIKISFVLATIGALMLIVGSIAGSASGDSNSGYYMISMVGFFPLLSIPFIWLFSKKEEEEEDDYYDDELGKRIEIPSGVFGFENKSYITIEAMLRSAGFTNIQCIPLNDLKTGLLKKPNTVESISVNGETDILCDKYPSNAAILISYHSYYERGGK